MSAAAVPARQDFAAACSASAAKATARMASAARLIPEPRRRGSRADLSLHRGELLQAGQVLALPHRNEPVPPPQDGIERRIEDHLAALAPDGDDDEVQVAADPGVLQGTVREARRLADPDLLEAEPERVSRRGQLDEGAHRGPEQRLGHLVAPDAGRG